MFNTSLNIACALLAIEKSSINRSSGLFLLRSGNLSPISLKPILRPKLFVFFENPQRLRLLVQHLYSFLRYFCSFINSLAIKSVFMNNEFPIQAQSTRAPVPALIYLWISDHEISEIIRIIQTLR